MSADLHAQIMNLPCGVSIGYDLGTRLDVYRRGHRDARHAAAELAAAAEALHAKKVKQLREALELARIGIACTVERMRAEEHPDLDAMTLGLQHIDTALNATQP